MNLDIHLPALQCAAAFHAARIVRQLRLPPADRDDIRQDLLVDMIARLRQFDADRASIATFIDLVARHAVSAVLRKYRRERRLFGSQPVSINDPTKQDLRETIPNEGGLAALLGDPGDAHAGADLTRDVTRTVAALPAALRDLCALLQAETRSVARRNSGLSRATFYRRLRDIRLHFLVEGVRAAA